MVIACFYQVLAPATPPAPTHHATVIVPAPVQTPQPHHVTVVTMGPASVINTVSTSRQNLDTIVQVRHKIPPRISPLEGAVVTDICYPGISPGNPAHRGHPGEGWCRRGRAAEGGHRHFGACPFWRGRLRHSLKQRRAGWLFTALSSSLTSCAPPYTHMHAHTPTHKNAQADQGCWRLQTHSAHVQRKAGSQIEALIFFSPFFFYIHVMLYRDRWPA